MRLESGVNAGWEDVENSRWVIVKRGEISRGSLPPKIQIDKKIAAARKIKFWPKIDPKIQAACSAQCCGSLHCPVQYSATPR